MVCMQPSTMGMKRIRQDRAYQNSMAKDQSKTASSQKDQRAERLAEALRANLHRRKAQSRGRKATETAETKGKNQDG